MIHEEKIEAKCLEIPAYVRPSNPLQTSQEFYQSLMQRRTIRRFSRQAVDRGILLNAIRTAGAAPSGANCQPWFFALIESQDMKDKIREAAEGVERSFYSGRAPETWLNDLAPLGTTAHKPYLSVAPAIIAVFTRRAGDNRSGRRIYYPIESTGIAVGFLLAALHQVGLGTLTHTPKPALFLNEILDLDRSFAPFMLVVAGYPEVPVKVPDIQRKELADICRVY